LPARPDLERLAFAPLAVSDADPAAALHARCFDPPWSAADFRNFAEAPVYSGLLAWRGEELAGLLIVMTVGAEIEILTLAVAPEARRRGVGSAILRHFLNDAAAAGMEALFLEVGEANCAARALYEACGFRAIGVRPGYYQTRDGTENATIMKIALPAKTPTATAVP
jgi:[ribosomal protein S18]-alanine N-acetyltransferase